jgi:hypothetical protein
VKGRAKITVKKQISKAGKVNTLQSSGHYQKSDASKKKVNEYFGGDSTVMLSGDEDEDESDEDETDEDLATDSADTAEAEAVAVADADSDAEE